MLGFYKLINSKEKRQIEFVALGRNQIEYFVIDGVIYLAIYLPSPEQQFGLFFNLNDSQFTFKGINSYLLMHGCKEYIFTFEGAEGGNKLSISSRLLGFVPYKYYQGKLSAAGFTIIKSIIGKHITNLPS